jgi:hypothetical protein
VRPARRHVDGAAGVDHGEPGAQLARNLLPRDFVDLVDNRVAGFEQALVGGGIRILAA